MTDEQVPAEETADATQVAATNPELNDSEVENAQGEENTNKGDLRVPLKQTREELRQLREQLEDPHFIYEQARRHGLAEEQTDLQPDTPEYGTGLTAAQIQKIAKDQIEVEKAYEKYPELRKDEDLRYMVAGLINRGTSPLRAADKTFAKIREANAKAAQEAAEVEKKVVKTQEAAQTISSTSDKTSDDAEFENLYKLTKSRDPRVQRRAMIEFEKLKMTRGQNR